MDSEIFILTQCDKVGKNVAFSQCWLYGAEQLDLCATGRHVKALFDKPWNIE